MKLVIQTVKEASCTVGGVTTGAIEKGYMILVGIGLNDNLEIVEKMAKKVSKLRVFEDTEGKMNLDIHAVNGAILSVSQFTLYADTAKGNRPSFVDAAKGEMAKTLYEYFNEMLQREGIHVETGIFGADMKISLMNEGPKTFIIEG